jgi:uncharacterized protein YkwD
MLVLALAGASFFAACQPEQAPPPQQVPAGSPIPPSTTDGVTLTNNERTARGISPLSRAQDLDTKAQAHAEWMAANRRLAHSSITSGVTPPYSVLGENVGVGSSMQQVHNAFMNSPSHRGHTLDPRFHSIGVGAARGSDGHFYVVHVFKG